MSNDAKAVTRFAAQRVADHRQAGTISQVGPPPDEIERTKPAIDMIASDQIGIMHLEHTLIEAYEKRDLRQSPCP